MQKPVDSASTTKAHFFPDLVTVLNAMKSKWTRGIGDRY